MSTIWPAFEKALSEFNRKNNVDWTCRELQDNTARDIAERAFEIDDKDNNGWRRIELVRDSVTCGCDGESRCSAHSIPINICNLANFILGREAVTGEDFAEAGLAMMGGCKQCAASIACYNAYPAKDGYWRCGDCIRDYGYETVEEAKRAIFPPRKLEASDIATILAALRLFQRHYENVDAQQIAQHWPDHFAAVGSGEDEVQPQPLGSDDIDTLCEEINCGAVEL